MHTVEGLELTGTPNHKVKVMTADGPAWRRLDALQAGDAVLVKLGQHTGRFRALKQPQRQHGNQIMPVFPPILDEELAFFLGYMAGDGFVAQAEHDHRVGVSVAHDSYLIDEMPALLGRIFGSEMRVHRMQKPQDASVTFVLDNRAVKDFLTINGLGKATSVQVRVPRLIRQSPPEVVGAFLRGLFEADGSVLHSYPQLLSSSEDLIRETAALLIGLGCPVRIAIQPTDESHYGTAPMWSLCVRSTVGLVNWQTRIGCDARSRFTACLAFQPDQAREISYRLPNPEYWLAPVLESTRLPQIDARGRGQGKHLRATSPALRKKLLRYCRGDRQLTMSGYLQLQAEYPEFAAHARPVDTTWFLTVQDVVDAGEALTLDIEVEDNHTYLAGGWVTHNSRRGANMAVLRVDHPDIREFITCKTNESLITNFNISVGITDAFMDAVAQDGPFDLINPVDGAVCETVRAREIFDLIAQQAHHNGEPGVLFLDAANRQNPVPHLYELEATNPCGEQWLGPFENCCLGSINLAAHLTAEGGVDWELLQRSIEEATRFLDDVVTANAYVPAVPQLKEAAHRVRRIGLGIMGIADMMYRLGVRYGSEAGQEFAAQVMEFVRYHTMQASVQLARERGAFPAIEGSLYDPKAFRWEPPQPLQPYTRDWGRPALDWKPVVKGIKKHGIRNGAQNTVAPTGTISTVAGCEGYGCEPVFALSYIRHVNDNGQDLELQYTSPLFEQAMREAGLDDEAITRVIAQVNLEGSCQHVETLPEALRRAFVVSSDVTAEEHVRMQAAFQAFVDNSISKDDQHAGDGQPGGRQAGLQAGLAAGLQGPDRLRDRQPPEGGAGDPGHQGGQGRGRARTPDRDGQPGHGPAVQRGKEAASAPPERAHLPRGDAAGHDLRDHQRERARRRPALRGLPARLQGGVGHGRRDGSAGPPGFVHPAAGFAGQPPAAAQGDRAPVRGDRRRAADRVWPGTGAQPAGWHRPDAPGLPGRNRGPRAGRGPGPPVPGPGPGGAAAQPAARHAPADRGPVPGVRAGVLHQRGGVPKMCIVRV